MTVDTHQEKMNFQAEVKQLLNIVVHSLYSNKEIFLRELVSNASDAADKLRFEALSNAAWYESDPDMRVRVTFDKDARTITISDNGIGMSRDEVIANLGTIAKSGTKEFLAKLTGEEKQDANLIGQFGVGFYSGFIVADKVTVKTRRAGLGAEYGVSWESAGDGEYTIENINKPTRGTDIILHLKEGEDDFLNEWRLRNIITKYSDHLNLPIQMQKLTDDGKPTAEWEAINKATALWTVPKSQITDEQYKEFYKHLAHDFEDPQVWTHHKVEGSKIDYTTILYLPSRAPFDLWQRDTQHGLKLYVQRVFIMDQVEQFLPHYLRFVRGVLDTNSLPLNISREILQDHPNIPKLKSAIVRHILDLLERIAATEPENYKSFWANFGTILKEGPAEDFANRDRIAKLLRFSSSNASSADQTVSLDDYVGRMKPNQKKIYYITAENYHAAKSSPHLEVFLKNNIEVLLLTDKIDEWVVGHLPEFEGKALQSVAKGDLELDDLIDAGNDKAAEEEKEKSQQKEFDQLIGKMKELLTAEVKDVRLSHRLTSSPACLVRDQNDLNPQMERLLKAAGQQVDAVKPILEVNPEHAILLKLREGVSDSQLNEWVHILYDQAVLAEGSQLSDPAGFVSRMNNLWMSVIK